MPPTTPLPRDALEARRAELEAELGEPITLDGLSATFHVFQRRRGHRHSTDDLLTAWYALEKGGTPKTTLDLGTGIGGVGLLVLSALDEDAHLTCIEAQEISFRFLTENVRANGVEDRVTAIFGDLRELRLSQRFPLVTGSPPYFGVGAGIVPSDSQKAHARFELRGDVRDYVQTARHHLTGDGTFVFCFPTAQKARAELAARDGGFAIVAQRDVVPREGLPPLFTLFACRLGAHDPIVEPAYVVRDAAGAPTSTHAAARRRFGFP